MADASAPRFTSFPDRDGAGISLRRGLATIIRRLQVPLFLDLCLPGFQNPLTPASRFAALFSLRRDHKTFPLLLRRKGKGDLVLIYGEMISR